MRLLSLGPDGGLSLTPFSENIPPYAILSHTWGTDDDEVDFEDLKNGSGDSKIGYNKIRFCGQQASKDGLHYFWVDTCCIDKANHTELSEAITSMFRWYRDSEKCYVYLSDVLVRNRDNTGLTESMWESTFQGSKWFTRGWTLQELIAPKQVEFFSQEGEHLGNKYTLEQLICKITDIPVAALRGASLSGFTVDERFRWAEKRKTKRKEDKAYCLLGIFEVFMPLMYGEGDYAFNRLKKEVYASLETQGVTKLADFRREEAIRKNLNSLQATDPGLDMKRIQNSKDPVLKECYEWILKDTNLQEWRYGNEIPLLWIKGDPGKGKTMLMIALACEFMKSSSPNSSAVTFFLCQATDPRLNSAVSILRGLIWKLAMDHSHLSTVFCGEYESYKNQLNSPNAVYALFSILSAMLSDSPGTFVLIDALDECNAGPERDQLLQLITEHAQTSSKAKWLLASRNHSAIKQRLEQDSRMLSLELNEEHVSNAVHSFIAKKTCELAEKQKYDSALTTEVKKQLMAKAKSTFLWVSLACKRLLQVKRWKTLSTLETLPPGLEGLYARMMEQVLQIEDVEVRTYSLQILRSVSLSFRPLSIEDLTVTAGLPTNRLNNEDLSELVEHCASIIIVRENILYFVHQSAKDYLVADGSHLLFADIRREHGLVVDRSLDAMSKSLKRDMCNLRHPGSAPPATINRPLKAISYACSFWVDHFAGFLGDSSIDELRYKKYFFDSGPIPIFFRQHLLHWFEALSLIGEVDQGIMGLQKLEKILMKSTSDDIPTQRDFVHDAIRIFRQSRTAVEKAPLQVYSSALIFSPEISIVRQHFKDEVPRWISPLPRVLNNWNLCLQVFEGHTDSVLSVAFSPCGQQLGSGSRDHTVRLWDSSTGTCLQVLNGHTDWVSSVAFSPSGQQLASGSHDRTVRLWECNTSTCLQVLQGHSDWVSSVAFSPNGQQLGSGSRDHTVRLWDSSTGTCLQVLKGHTRCVSSVAFSPSGQQLASGSHDCTVRLWECNTSTCLQMLQGHSDWVSSVAFSPDGQQLASGSADAAIRLWDSSTGTCLQVLEGHISWVFSVVFSPSGQQLASGSSDRTVRLWDSSTSTCLQVLEGHTEWVSSVAFSPSGQQLASGSGNYKLRLWDTNAGTCLQVLDKHTDWVRSVVFSPNRQQLASGSHDRTVRLWDPSTGICLQTLEGHSDWVSSVAFSPNGQQLASGSCDHTVQLWDSATGTCLQVLEGHTEWVLSVAFSPNGQQLASGSDDAKMRLWDPCTGTCLQVLEGHTDSVTSVTFSPNGQQLASGSHDDTLRLWDSSAGTCLQVLKGHTHWVSSVAFSPSGQQLASGSHDRTVRLWECDTGTCLQVLEGHTDWISSVTFSPSGQQLGSESRDRTVRLWDSSTGTCLQVLKGSLSNVSFSLDGSNLVKESGIMSLRETLQSVQAKSRGAIESDNMWVTWDGNKVLWLPPGYRPGEFAATENCMGIGCNSGIVFFLNFLPHLLNL